MSVNEIKASTSLIITQRKEPVEVRELKGTDFMNISKFPIFRRYAPSGYPSCRFTLGDRQMAKSIRTSPS
jgi:hypothetical protein